MSDIYINDKIIENIKLVVFDKDGTLIEIHKYWAQMILARAKGICQKANISIENVSMLMNAMGVNFETMMLKPEGPVGIKKREVVLESAVSCLAKIGLNSEYARKIIFDVFLDIDKLSLEKLSEFIIPINGALNLISKLKNLGVKIAIATTDKTERAEIALKHLKWDHYFDFVVGADMVSLVKPDKEMIELIMLKLNVSRQQTIMVGDAETDILMGFNADVKASIGVLTGLSSRDKLLPHTEFIVNSVEDIKVL
ncbi:MAG: HAD family hydrolase [Oligoflexia bacterium]|nr:HAD family hydrolase [Oligoflexia bacterium]